MCIMCINGCSLISLKQFSNFTLQKLVERVNISCKVTFALSIYTFVYTSELFSDHLSLNVVYLRTDFCFVRFIEI